MTTYMNGGIFPGKILIQFRGRYFFSVSQSLQILQQLNSGSIIIAIAIIVPLSKNLHQVCGNGCYFKHYDNSS